METLVLFSFIFLLFLFALASNLQLSFFSNLYIKKKQQINKKYRCKFFIEFDKKSKLQTNLKLAKKLFSLISLFISLLDHVSYQ